MIARFIGGPLCGKSRAVYEARNQVMFPRAQRIAPYFGSEDAKIDPTPVSVYVYSCLGPTASGAYLYMYIGVK